ncbi:MAG: 30S ribosomal protein S3 [Candidatus Doudnabacteria bacterium]
MGHKISPTSLRLNITETWKSRWFSKNNFARTLQEDVQIREYLMLNLKKAGIVRIDIERLNDGGVTVIIKSTKPGMIIGKGGNGIEDLKKKIKSKISLKKDLKINIEEVRDVNLQALVIAQNIAESLEKRVSYRRLIKQSIEQIMNAGAKGVKIAIGGRLGGAEIARTEWLSNGKLPLHTLRANIDFAKATAFTTYGTLGVKVWINKGEVFVKEAGAQAPAPRPAFNSRPSFPKKPEIAQK